MVAPLRAHARVVRARHARAVCRRDLATIAAYGAERPLPGLDGATAAVRTAVGIADGVRRLPLLTAAAPQRHRGGPTIAEVADGMRRLGAVGAFSPEGGGSTAPVAGCPARARCLCPTSTPACCAAQAPAGHASEGHGRRPLTRSAVAVSPLWMVGAMLVLAR
ncbi:phosphodiester glycosidase family protein [Streptomyces sp. NPDC004752]